MPGHTSRCVLAYIKALHLVRYRISSFCTAKMMNTYELCHFLARVLEDHVQVRMLGMHTTRDGAVFSARKPSGSVSRPPTYSDTHN